MIAAFWDMGRLYKQLLDDLPRRMDDWVHAYREQSGQEPDAQVEARRVERLRSDR